MIMNYTAADFIGILPNLASKAIFVCLSYSMLDATSESRCVLERDPVADDPLPSHPF
jgi:hypothetical protein